MKVGTLVEKAANHIAGVITSGKTQYYVTDTRYLSLGEMVLFEIAPPPRGISREQLRRDTVCSVINLSNLLELFNCVSHPSVVLETSIKITTLLHAGAKVGELTPEAAKGLAKYTNYTRGV